MQTIELNGRSIAVVGDGHDQVENFAESDSFRTDLLTFLDSDGRPLWNGQGAVTPSVRPATAEETAAFHRSFEDAVAAGEADAGDPADWLMFLVDVHEADEGTEA